MIIEKTDVDIKILYLLGTNSAINEKTKHLLLVVLVVVVVVLTLM